MKGTLPFQSTCWLCTQAYTRKGAIFKQSKLVSVGSLTRKTIVSTGIGYVRIFGGRELDVKDMVLYAFLQNRDIESMRGGSRSGSLTVALGSGRHEPPHL